MMLITKKQRFCGQSIGLLWPRHERQRHHNRAPEAFDIGAVPVAPIVEDSRIDEEVVGRILNDDARCLGW